MLLSLFCASADAIRFHSYTNEKGETVYSNLPRKCVSDSIMTCAGYHPVNRDVETQQNTLDKAPSAKQSSRNKKGYSTNTAPSGTGFPTTGDQLGQEQLFGILENIVEMKGVLDKYFPGSSDPQEATKVRQQQQQILGVLQGIKQGADSDERPLIERAINILRENLAN